MLRDTRVVLLTLFSTCSWFLDNTSSGPVPPFASSTCVCAYHLFGTVPLPLPSSLKLRTPGKDRRAFGTRSRMNFSFTFLRQLSPPLYFSLALTGPLPLSLASIVSRSVYDSTPTSRGSKHKSVHPPSTHTHRERERVTHIHTCANTACSLQTE